MKEESDETKHLRIIKFILYFFAIILVAYLLKILSGILIPLVLSFFIALLLYPLINWLVSKKVPYWLSVILVISVISILGYLIIHEISDFITDFATNEKQLVNKIKLKFLPLLDWLRDKFRLDIPTLYKKMGPAILTYIPANFMIQFFSGILITILYLAFLLSGNILKTEKVIREVISNNKRSSIWIHAFQEIRSSISQYIFVKTIISVLTGVGYTIICFAFGIKFAVLWGFIAFIFNFIPNVGSLIATIPVFLLALMEIDSVTVFLLFMALLLTTQQVMGNIVEPVWMGKSFSLNTIVVLFGLVLFSYLWGIIGAILAVPLLVFIKVSLQHIPGTGFFVRLMENHNYDSLKENSK